MDTGGARFGGGAVPIALHAGGAVDDRGEALRSLSELLMVDEEWLSRRHEPALAPELSIVDPHHHLWGAPRQRYLIPEFLADMKDGHRVSASVYVECYEGYRSEGPEELRPVGETESVATSADELRRSDPNAPRIAAGIIGYADLTAGAKVQETLEAHLAAGRGRFRGVRQSAAWDPNKDVRTTIRMVPQGLLRESRLREGFARLSPLGLTFDCWVYHPQLSDVADLARSFPETAIILDHSGGPLGISEYAGQRSEVMEVWKRGIVEVAKCPNVRIKIGGLGMRSTGFGFRGRPLPPSSEELAAAWRPFVQICVDAFGPSRSMFESNFPADKTSASYSALWNAFKILAMNYSATEKAEMFSKTATATYALDNS